MSKRAIQRLRTLCLSFPEAREKLSHNEPTWFAGTGKVFCMCSDHHHDDRVGFWCPQPSGTQEALLASAPARFFRPPYVGGKGWIGVRLDVDPIDWDEIAEVIEEGYRSIASKRLVAKLDARRASRARMPKSAAYRKLRTICTAFPDVVQKPFGGHTTPCWRVRDKIFCGTGQVGRARMTFKAGPGVQQALVGSDPERFFVPPYSGSKGWVGAWLDVDQDWDELAELVEEAYRLIAPKVLVKRLDEARDSGRVAE